MKSFLLTTLIVSVGIYAALVGLVYFGQRALMYFPDRARTMPAEAGLPQAEEIFLNSDADTRVIVWHVPPQKDKPVFLYFTGNAGALWMRAPRFREMTADGSGLVALSYRGYGGSGGAPDEDGLIADAMAAYAFATSLYAPERIVLWGESLGSAIAVAVAAKEPVRALILETPFTSAADIGAEIYPFLPVRLLMKDQYRTDLRIKDVRAPILILHGERDAVIPFAMGQRLFALAPEPKHFAAFPQGEHETLDRHGAQDQVRAFLRNLPATPMTAPTGAPPMGSERKPAGKDRS